MGLNGEEWGTRTLDLNSFERVHIPILIGLPFLILFGDTCVTKGKDSRTEFAIIGV